MIVCTLDRPGPMATLLGALARQHRPADETLVVDASADDTTESVVRGFPEVRYRRARPEERGLTRQRNVGIANTEGDIVAFLDDDTVPEPEYVGALLDGFTRHARAVGVGGYLTEVDWRRRSKGERPAERGTYRAGRFVRREDLRWRLRRRLGLDSTAAPGIMPPSGHPRPLGFLPPDGRDHEVDFVMGGAAAWKRSLFDAVRFDEGFEGYGLYEDLDFCLRARRHGDLVLAGRARLAHEHAPSGRPDHRRYGRMVVENGWYVWRVAYPRPAARTRLRWWLTTGLLAACRAGDVARRRDGAFAETRGRLEGMARVLTGRARRPAP